MFESELEYNPDGNIRASTYKRTADSVALRFISEQRKADSFFSKDYLENRYVNDRVEMELSEFK